jgi:hypothetical protein
MTTGLQSEKFPRNKIKKFFPGGILNVDSSLQRQRPMIGRKGWKNNEDYEISFIGSGSGRGYGFEHSVCGERRWRDPQRCFDRGELLQHEVPGDS